MVSADKRKTADLSQVLDDIFDIAPLFFVDAPMLWKGIILSLLGVSYGLGNVALQAAMFTASPPDIVGTTSGLFQTCRYLGSIFSSVILGLLLLLVY